MGNEYQLKYGNELWLGNKKTGMTHSWFVDKCVGSR